MNDPMEKFDDLLSKVVIAVGSVGSARVGRIHAAIQELEAAKQKLRDFVRSMAPKPEPEPSHRTQWEHDGNLREVSRHMQECGLAWEPKVRLIGNCRAEDIAAIAAHYLQLTDSSRNPVGPGGG